MTISDFSRYVCSVMLLASIVGCSAKPASVEVEGTVSLDGQPVHEAEVTMILAEGNGPSFRSTTDAQGRFATDVLVGDYKILVSKPLIGPHPAKSSLPEVYQHFATTPFSCSLPKDQQLTLALTSDSPQTTNNLGN